MDDLRMEAEAGGEVDCAQCGRAHRRATGKVFKAEAVCGAYSAVIHDGAVAPHVTLALSLADAAGERSWVLMNVVSEESEVVTRFLDATEAPDGAGDFGRPLTRAAAIATSMRREFFETADFLVENDPALAAYLGCVPPADEEQE